MQEANILLRRSPQIQAILSVESTTWLQVTKQTLSVLVTKFSHAVSRLISDIRQLIYYRPVLLPVVSVSSALAFLYLILGWR